MSSIPPAWAERNEFRVNLCGITQKPIRFIVGVLGSGMTASIFYEKKTVYLWIEKYPNTPPQNWPSGILYTDENIIELPNEQREINRLLQEAFDKFKRDHDGL